MTTLFNFAQIPLPILQIHCAKCLLRRNVKIKGWGKVVQGEATLSSHSLHTSRTDRARHSDGVDWIKPTGYNTGIHIHNTLTKQKEELILPRGKHLSWYMCGPTVYDASHIGHASNYIRFDIIRRILQDFFDINVICLVGITDIDDKIIKRSQELDQHCSTISCYYERQFFQEMLALNMKAPTATCRVTDNIPPIIDFVQGIMNRGHAYKVDNGSVYFDVEKYGSYNKFVPPQLDMSTHTGVKKNFQDFALWKAAKPGEPSWASPWGPGRPGWHIECSAMASRVFGSSFDIHSGGQDLVFPHHENELAQSCSYHGCSQWANYWMHTGHLHLQHDPEKMSKSLKNTISTAEMLGKYSANQFRMFCMLSNYRHNIEFTDESMKKAVSLDNKIGNFLRQCEDYIYGNLTGGDISEADLLEKIEEAKVHIMSALADDFKTPAAMEALLGLIHHVSTRFTEKETKIRSPGAVATVAVFVKRICKKLGFHKRGWKMSQDSDRLKLKEVLDHTVKFRWNVREYAKNISPQLPDTLSGKAKKAERKRLSEPFFSASDELRSQLSCSNITVMDHKDYSSWEFTDSFDGSADDSPWDSDDESSAENKINTEERSKETKEPSSQDGINVSQTNGALGKHVKGPDGQKNKNTMTDKIRDSIGISNKVKPKYQDS